MYFASTTLPYNLFIISLIFLTLDLNNVTESSYSFLAIFSFSKSLNTESVYSRIVLNSNKTSSRFKTLTLDIATFNFLFAFVILFVSALIYGSISTKPVVANVSEGYPAYTAGIKEGDTIVSINKQRVSSWSEVQLYIQASKGEQLNIVLKDKSGTKREVTLVPDKVEDKEGNVSYVVGIGLDTTVRRGLGVSLKHAVETTASLYKLMITTLKELVTGKFSVKDLSGPVGIYSVVDSQSKKGFESILSLVAYLSMNVGVINLIPFPAFDGGRVLFLIIEKIRRKPIKAKTEGMINSIGFILLMLLMVFVTISDVIKLF